VQTARHSGNFFKKNQLASPSANCLALGEDFFKKKYSFPSVALGKEKKKKQTASGVANGVKCSPSARMALGKAFPECCRHSANLLSAVVKEREKEGWHIKRPKAKESHVGEAKNIEYNECHTKQISFVPLYTIGTQDNHLIS
jgi:hypothetical protein